MNAVALTPALAWLATFAVHSSLAGAFALMVSLLLRRRAIALQESLLRWSLWVGVVSSSLQFVLPVGWWLGAPLGLEPVLVDPAAPTATVATAEWPLAANGPAAAAAPSAAWTWPWSWQATLLMAALAAAVAGLGWLVVVHRRLVRVLATRHPETDARVLTTAAAVAARLGLRQSPHVSRSPLIATPIAFGWLRPEICLPIRAATLGDDSLRAMLAHEVAHLRRGDPAWMWLAAWLTALCPWHPVLHLVRRRWARLVEHRCDAVAAQHSSPAAVARCLLDVAEWLRPAPVAIALGMAARPSALRERVEAVLRAAAPHAPNRAAAAVFGGLSLTALTVAAPGGAVPAATAADLTFVGPVAPMLLEAAPEPAAPPAALELLVSSLRDERLSLQAEAAELYHELALRRASPELRQLQANLRQRLSDLERSQQRLDALLGRRASRSR